MSAGSSPEPDRWLGVAVSAASLLGASAVPLPARYNPDFGPLGPDKLLHLLGHAGLAAALFAALEREGSALRVGLLAVAASTLFGVGIELLQERIPGREFERGDVLAGLLGSLLGVAVRRRSGSGPAVPGEGR